MIKNICIATDDSYLIGAKVLIASIAKSTSKTVKSELTINLAYLPGKLSKNNIQKLNQICLKLGLNLEFHAFESEITDEDIFAGPQARKHISSTTLAKFYFFDTMMEPFLWLDTDIAVRDGWEQLLEYDSQLSRERPYLVAGDNPQRFNAGVMGSFGRSPIENWKSDIGNHSTSVEQHIFVGAMKNSSVRCSTVFNSISRWGSTARTKDGLVIHYGGPIKPWHFRSIFWTACKLNSCGWHTWYESAEYLADFDADMDMAIQENAKVSPPVNPSLKIRLFLGFCNNAYLLSLPLASLIRLLPNNSGTTRHPFCSTQA